MVGVFISDVLTSPAGTAGTQPPADDRGQRLARLEETVGGLRQEVVQLRQENAELKQQVGDWKAMHARAVEREAKLTGERETARGEIRQLRGRLFGRQSERATPTDRSNQRDDPPEPPAAQAPRRRGQQPGRRGPGRRDDAHLPAGEEFLALPEGPQHGPDGGQPRRLRFDSEDSEQIEIEVRAHRRVLRRRRYASTCHCPDQPRTLTAPAPPKLIPKSRFGVSLGGASAGGEVSPPPAAGTYRRRLGTVGLAAGQRDDDGRPAADRTVVRAGLQALVDRQVASGFSHADETRWWVFIEREGQQGHRWWLWVFLSPDSVVFRLDPSRSHHVPEQHFPEHSSRVLLVDRYAAYQVMVQVKDGHILLAFCWAHVRRDFVEVGKGWPELQAWALAWLRRIRELYRLNRERLAARPDSPAFQEADSALRQAVVTLELPRECERAEPQLREPCRKTLESLQEHWEGLVRFVDDPRIPRDNHGSERRLRGPAVGRKNYDGSAAEWSGRLAAQLFSLFATLELWKINPRRWLTWFLEACAAAGGQAPADITEFLPWNLTSARQAELMDPNPRPAAAPKADPETADARAPPDDIISAAA